MTWAIDSGRIAVAPGVRQVGVTVDVSSGRLACTARLDDRGRVDAVAFRNVPSFVLARDVEVATARGALRLDVAFGGAFYGSLDARVLGLHVEPSALPELIALQRELRPALERALDVVHAEQPDLAGIYGVIFWEPVEAPDGERHGQRNVAVFADGEVDRSPCGSGTSARLAVLHARGEIGVGETLRHRSIVDSVFDARVIGAGPAVGPHASVMTEVEGSAFLTGRHTFSLDDRDPLGTGFLLR